MTPARRLRRRKRVARVVTAFVIALCLYVVHFVSRFTAELSANDDNHNNNHDDDDDGIGLAKDGEPWFSTPDGAVVVRSCFDRLCNLHYGARSADGFVLRMYGAQLQMFSHRVPPPAVWHIWVAGGLQAANRLPPKLPTTRGAHLVMNVPGSNQFAALGRQRAAEICPETWTKADAADLLAYGRAHPDARFIFKFGHRQTGMQVHDATDPRLPSIVQSSVAKVIQRVQADALLLPNGGHVAFRTYTWFRCLPASVQARIDFNSPAYLNHDNVSLISSGYTPSKGNFTSTSAFMRRFLTPLEIELMRASMRDALTGFLHSFGASMCAFASSEHLPKPDDVVCELYGFDWLPVRSTATGRVGVKLLETNRFPDMQLHSHDASDAKDVVKVCTFARVMGHKLLAQCPPADFLTLSWSFAS